MSAAITDLLTQVGQNGTITSLSSPGKAIGASSINVGSTTNWPTATAVFFAMRQVNPTSATTANPSGLVSGTYTEWKGTVSGTTISNLTLQQGSDQVYPAGTNTQVFIVISSSRENALVTWGTAHATQLGALLPSAVQTAIGTNGILASNLATNAITLGYTALTSGNFVTSSSTAVQVPGLTVTVTIPAGGRYVRISAYAPGLWASSSGSRGDLTIWDGAVGSGTQLQDAWSIASNGGGVVSCLASVIVAPSAGSKTYNVGLHTGFSSGNTNLQNATGQPAYILVEAI